MNDNRMSCLILLLLLFPSLVFAAPKFMVVGLFKDKAILDINGKQRLLAAGHQAPEGITLISANSKEAVIEIEENAQPTLSATVSVVNSRPRRPALQFKFRLITWECIA